MAKEPETAKTQSVQAAQANVATPKAPAKRERKRVKSDAEEVLGERFLSRVDPDEDFSDVDGDPRNEFGLLEEESDRHYHYASKEDIDSYLGGVVPYRIERHAEGGAKLLMGVERPQAGEPIAKKGMLLVSCDKAKWQKRNRFEYVQGMKRNESLMKRRQRDTDLRDRTAFEEEFAEVRG